LTDIFANSTSMLNLPEGLGCYNTSLHLSVLYTCNALHLCHFLLLLLHLRFTSTL